MDTPISLQSVKVSGSLEEVLRLGVVIFRNLSIGEQNPDLTQAIKGTAEELTKSLEHRQPSSLAPVIRSRRLYHHVGLDPTKHRPSSEKLLRRVLKGHPFPRINDFVDAMNLVSVRLQFPLGLYDWDQLVLPILVRIGSPGEKYQGLSGEMVNLAGKVLLVDGEGPFGNPTQDSQRSLVGRRSVRALVTIFGPADTPKVELEEALQEVVSAGQAYCDGQQVVSGILP